MDILPLIAIAFVVLFIYSWQRSRPKSRAGKKRRSGLSGQDSSPGFVDGASTRGAGATEPPPLPQIMPKVSAFKVAAARVEHCSLRNTLSTCVRTVLGLMPRSRATSLLLAPLLMRCRICVSRSLSRPLPGLSLIHI